MQTSNQILNTKLYQNHITINSDQPSPQTLQPLTSESVKVVEVRYNDKVTSQPFRCISTRGREHNNTMSRLSYTWRTREVSRMEQYSAPSILQPDTQHNISSPDCIFIKPLSWWWWWCFIKNWNICSVWIVCCGVVVVVLYWLVRSLMWCHVVFCFI